MAGKIAKRRLVRSVPFVAESGSALDSGILARGLMILPEAEIDWDEFLNLPIANGGPMSLTQALLDERAEGR